MLIPHFLRDSTRHSRAWSGHRVVVIGGEGGIGEELCRQCADAGGIVTSLDISTGFDVTDAATVNRWFADHPEVGTVIYAAGIAASGLLTRPESTEQIRSVMDVNIMGLVTVAGAAAQQIRQHRGRVVVLNSAFSLITAPGYGAYSASKAPLSMAVSALRPELSPATVTDCVLGGVDTPIFDRAADRAGTQEARDVAERFRRRIARNDAADVAAAILRAALARRSRAAIGKDAALITGAHRIAPSVLQKAVDRLIGNPFGD